MLMSFAVWNLYISLCMCDNVHYLNSFIVYMYMHVHVFQLRRQRGFAIVEWTLVNDNAQVSRCAYMYMNCT